MSPKYPSIVLLIGTIAGLPAFAKPPTPCPGSTDTSCNLTHTREQCKQACPNGKVGFECRGRPDEIGPGECNCECS